RSIPPTARKQPRQAATQDRSCPRELSGRTTRRTASFPCRSPRRVRPCSEGIWSRTRANKIPPAVLVPITGGETKAFPWRRENWYHPVGYHADVLDDLVADTEG